jgi:hypothetical protein
MASFTKTNGDVQPVFALDTANGKIASDTATAGTPVNLQGPKLDFFRLVANTSVAGEQGVSEYVDAVLKAVQQKATIAIYQVDATAISLAVYPAGAYTDSTILSTANVAYTGFQLNSATGASVGFKLTT